MGGVGTRLPEMGRRQCRPVLHSGDLAGDDALGRDLLQTSLPVTLACSRAMVEADFRAEMRGIDVPTLIVHGDRDRSMPVELTGKPSADLIPGSRLLIYPGAPHGLMFTHMGELNADLAAFMRERERRSAAA